jgi:hypothetical protein
MQRAYGLSVLLVYMVLAISPGSAQLISGSVPTGDDGVIKGKPYEASKTRHTRVVLADGTIATQDSQILEARDGNGRVVREVRTEIPVGSGLPPVVVTLIDPETRTMLIWTSLAPVATLIHLPPSGIRDLGSSKEAAKVPLALPKPEIIGHRVIHGMLTTGRRSERSIAAGTMGNGPPTSVTREWWTNDDLRFTVLETSSDPQNGERTTELIDIKLGEPDATRFHVPAGYVVSESQQGDGFGRG